MHQMQAMRGSFPLPSPLLFFFLSTTEELEGTINEDQAKG
jgi:hypothetical protein